ncbi:MAG: hypothetical protein OEY11_00815 [Gammaproteobacteria bacterium]|nr:hypothetical protein [Gammaproteobacteria bacterium]
MFNSVSDARKTISALKVTLKREDGCSDFEVFSIIDALSQVFDVVAAVNKQQQKLSADEITVIGEQALSLIDNLVYKLMTQNLESHKHEVEHVALIMANWVIKHKGELINIQSVVDALAYMANAVEDKVSLLQLSTFMSQVAHACSNALQHDLDNTDPSRPWRILNMNRGIVATRSHDIDIMRREFAELITAIPMDAPDFFKQGMSEMERLNYPQPVRDVMQEFYDQTQLPSVH